MGLAATAFIKGLSLAEDVFERIHNGYLRHAIGMLLIGAMMYALLRTSGQYYVDGVGYATIQAILTGSLVLPGLLALLVRREIVRDLDQPRLGRLGRHLLAVAVYGRDHWRRLRRRDQRRSSHRRSRRHHLRDDRHGRHGRRRYRRGHDRGDHDLRDDARLRPGNADHRRGGAGDRRAAAIVAGEHLHGEARRAAALRTQGAARQHVPGAPRRRGDGARRNPAAERHAAGNVPASSLGTTAA